jgi:hypothetical protein
MRLVEDESDLEIPPSYTADVEIPSRDISFEISLMTPLMEFPRPGRYRYDILMNDVYLGSTFIQVDLVKN